MPLHVTVETARWAVAGIGLYGSRHVRDGQIDAPQAAFIKFDTNLGVAETGKIDLVDAKLKQIIPDPSGEYFERTFRKRAGNRKPGQNIEKPRYRKSRRFGLIGKGGNAIQRLFNLVLGVLQIGARLQFEPNRRGPLAGIGAHILNAFQKAQGGLHIGQDIFRNVFGAGSGPTDGDSHRIDFN